MRRLGLIECASLIGVTCVVLWDIACSSGDDDFPRCPNCFTVGVGGSSTVGNGGAGGSGNGGATSGPELAWVVMKGDAAWQVATSVATDESGNSYATGFYTGAVDFGAGVALPATTTYSSFLVKLDPDGTAVWAHSFGQQLGMKPGSSSPRVITDPNGDVIVGSVQGTTTVVGIANPITLMGPSNAFVAKLDAAGAAIWAVEADVEDIDAMDTDAMGNIYVSGYESFSDVFGDPDDPNSWSVWVAKLDSAGMPLWVEQFTSTDPFFVGYDIDVDAGGNVALAGAFEGNIQAGTIPVPGNDPQTLDVFVLKLDAQGAVTWAKGFGNTVGVVALGVHLASDGTVDACGSLWGTVNFGGTTLVNMDTQLPDIFALELDGVGTVTRATSWEVPESQNCYAMAPAPNDEFVIGGGFRQSLTLVQPPFDMPVATDFFIAQFTASGTPRWALTFTGDFDQQLNDVAVDSAGRITFAGYSQGNLDLGTTMLTHAGDSDIVIGRILP